MLSHKKPDDVGFANCCRFKFKKVLCSHGTNYEIKLRYEFPRFSVGYWSVHELDF